MFQPSPPMRASAGFIEPCLPTRAQRPPCGPGWVCEIKHDGYRLVVRKMDERVRIYTRRGYDWTDRFPRIVEGVKRLRVRSVILDGEGVVCGKDGVSNFDRLHSKTADHEVFLYAFDVLELDGQDFRREQLLARKATLSKLLRRVKDGIVLNEHTEHDGELVFEHACRMGLEGIVCKRVDASYRSGRCRSWVKVKNPKSPAMLRIADGNW